MPREEQQQRHKDWVLSVLQEYEERLRRYAHRLTHDEHAAADLVQHTFMKLCDQPPDAIRGDVRAWLYAVCRNRAFDTMRKERRMESFMETFSENGQAVLESHEADPAVACEESDAAEQLRQAVATLSETQQEALDLWSEGFSYREISRITERAEGSIRVLVHRGIRRLRDHPTVRQLLELDPARGLADANHPTQ